jgi:outer membrane protein
MRHLKNYLCMKYKIFFFTFSFSFNIFFAQNVKVLTYEEAINIALNESYTIKSYQENQRSMQYSYFYYKAMFKPRLDLNLFTPSWNEQVSPVYQTDGLPVYNSFSSFQLGGDLKFTYVLPTGGNLALHSLLYRENLSTTLATQSYVTLRTQQAYSQLGISFDQPILTRNTLRESLKEAEYQFSIATSSFTRQQMNIIYNVTQGFYGLYKQIREAEISRDKFKNSEDAYRIAKLKAETGRIPEGDMLIAEVAAAQNSAQLSESLGKQEREKDNFKQFIGLDINQEIKIITDIKYDTFHIDLNKAIEEALKNRLEINESELQIKLQQIQLDRAKREREISGKISAYYDVTGLSTIGTGTTNELFRSSFDNIVDRPPNRGVTLTFSIPILDWGRGRAKVQKAKAEYNYTVLSKDDKLTTITREVRDIVRTVEESRNRLKIHEKNQIVANKSYKVSLLRFGNGDITSQQLATEQERLSDSQLAFLDAYITYQLAVVDLKRKTMWDFQNNRSYLDEIKETQIHQ